MAFHPEAQAVLIAELAESNLAPDGPVRARVDVEADATLGHDRFELHAVPE